MLKVDPGEGSSVRKECQTEMEGFLGGAACVAGHMTMDRPSGAGLVRRWPGSQELCLRQTKVDEKGRALQ